MSAVVGPLRQIRFRDGSTQVYDPPRDTRDLRYVGCADHRPACDCREAEMAERITEMRAEAELAGMAEQAITAVLRIHARGQRGSRYCQGCRQIYPCPTRVLLAPHSWLIRFEETQR